MSDDDDWEDLERAPKAGYLPDVALRISKFRHGAGTSRIVFRGEPAKRVFDAGPRFKVQIGGDSAEKLRLVAMANGAYECVNKKGAAVIVLGAVNVWPDEARDPVAVTWTGHPAQGGMVLVLPLGFSKPGFGKAKPAVATPIGPVGTNKPPASVVGRPAAGPVHLGDPAPGRSALDQRRREQGR